MTSRITNLLIFGERVYLPFIHRARFMTVRFTDGSPVMVRSVTSWFHRSCFHGGWFWWLVSRSFVHDYQTFIHHKVFDDSEFRA